MPGWEKSGACKASRSMIKVYRPRIISKDSTSGIPINDYCDSSHFRVFSHNMSRKTAIYFLLCCGMPGVLPAQRAVNPVNRYFRLICLVHLTGSGKGDAPVMPEYVAEGVKAAQAASQTETLQAKAAASIPAGETAQAGAKLPGTSTPMTSRPGILAWSMLPSDDKTMAIVQVVAADRAALAPFLNDKRPEIRVFEIGRDSKEKIEAELRKYKSDFDLASFQVVAQ